MMNQPVQLDYTLVTYIVVAIFGLVGFMRGWWKEAFTTGLLALLLLLLKQPDAAAGIVDFIDRMVVSGWNAIQTVRQSSDMIAAAMPVEEPPVIDPKDRSIYIIILVVAIVASYFFSKIGMTESMSAAARIIGGVLGVYNGYVVLTLVREFLIGRFLPGGADMAAAAAVAPTSVQLEVTNLPQSSMADAPYVYYWVAAGCLALLVALITAVKFGRQQPWGYSSGGKRDGSSGNARR
jgi:uncharacterized membrane protein required for colicin V production